MAERRLTRTGGGREVLSRLRAPPFWVLPFVLIALGLLALSGHAAARCFGVPETTEEEPAWALGLRVESAHGLWDLAYLGVDSRATDGFDPDFDVIEAIFERGLDPQADTIALFVYFFYPENPEAAKGTDNPTATVALTRSVVPPRDTVTWPLRVAYSFPGEMVLTLFWSPEAVRQSDFVIDLVTPFDGAVSMADAATYSFEATPGFYDFTLQARAKSSLGPPGESVLLAGVLAASAVTVGAILWLRRAGRRREPPQGRGEA
ncbi:MAG: hypothetical protein V3U30_00475 [Thermoplasmata archaeon]